MRRAVPYLLVGAVLACTAAGAVAGAAASPSGAAVSFEQAVRATLAARSFQYRGTVGTSVGVGTYRAPGRVAVTTTDSSHSEGYSLYHSTLHFEVGLSIHLPSSLNPPFGASIPPGLPPLDALRSATSVVRAGDTYTFVLPSVTVPVTGWVACGPSSCNAPPLPAVAHDVAATAVVRHGYLVALGLPNGVAAGRVTQPPSSYSFSHVAHSNFH